MQTFAQLFNVANMALPKTGGTMTGSITLGTLGNQVLGASSDTVSVPTFSWTGDLTTGVYRGGAGSIGIATNGVNRAIINSTGLTIPGTVTASNISGACISSLTTSTLTNVAASSGALKNTFDLATNANSTASSANTLANTANNTANSANSTASSANTLANTANNTANSANSTASSANTLANTANNTANTANNTANMALPKAGGSVTGDIILSTVGTQVLGAAADSVSNPSYSWTGDLTTGVYRVTTGSVGITTSGVNRATINGTGLIVVGSVNASSLSGACISSVTSSTSTTIAASSSSVKTAWDLANSASSTANSANTTANNAINTANSANTTANNANNNANTAINTANNALPKNGGASQVLMSSTHVSHALNITNSASLGGALWVSGANGGTTTGILTVDRAGWWVLANFYSSGNLNVRGTLTGGGADYAEYFEWEDKLTNEDNVGLTVMFVPGKDTIRIATVNDDVSEIIGVVSGNPTVIGNDAWSSWHGVYLRDEYDRIAFGDVEFTEWTDSDGKIHRYRVDFIPSEITIPPNAVIVVERAELLNPRYDRNVPYVKRQDRPEWVCVGLMGKLRIRASSPVRTDWKFIRNITSNVGEWLIR